VNPKYRLRVVLGRYRESYYLKKIGKISQMSGLVEVKHIMKEK
jgi:hypothetical protein